SLQACPAEADLVDRDGAEEAHDRGEEPALEERQFRQEEDAAAGCKAQRNNVQEALMIGDEQHWAGARKSARAGKTVAVGEDHQHAEQPVKRLVNEIDQDMHRRTSVSSRSITCSSVMCVVSIRIASAAGTMGPVEREASRRSRAS